MAIKEGKRVWVILPLLGSIGLFFLTPSLSHGKTAAEVLKAYEGLSGKERETKLIEGAKREGKMVYYGTTAIDHIKRVFDEFNKRYPSISIADYRITRNIRSPTAVSSNTAESCRCRVNFFAVR